MSWQILICRAKPNPAGKDRTPLGGPRQEQLLGEWVDLQNTGDASVNLSTLHLSNFEFLSGCVRKENPTIYWDGSADEKLAPNQILRVHTGKSLYSASMLNEDRNGVNLHAYAEKGNFVLNNKCGDILGVWWKDRDGKWHNEDTASYDPNPPEGAILRRIGPKLMP